MEKKVKAEKMSEEQKKKVTEWFQKKQEVTEAYQEEAWKNAILLCMP